MAANAGRKKKPAKLKLIEGRGNGRDSGGRKVQAPPGFRRIAPDKPDDLSADAGEMWDLIVDELGRVDLLKPLDELGLRVACETYARWQQARRMREENGLLAHTSQGQGAAPWVGIEERAGREFRAWCSEFGLTPAAESKVSAGKADGDGSEGTNPFAGS